MNGDVTSRVLFLSRDRGSVQATLPVIQTLGSASDFEVHVLSTRVSRALLEERRIGHEPLDEDWFASEPETCIGTVVGRFQPAMVVSGSSPARGPAPETPEQYLVLEARRRGTPSVGILDNWGRYEERFAVHARGVDTTLVPDRLCVLDRRSFDDLTSLGIPAAMLTITHNPWVDQFASLSVAGGAAVSSADVLKIVFASQPLAETRYVRDWPFTQESLLDMLVEALPPLAPGRSHELTVWPHPSEDPGRWVGGRSRRTDVLVLVTDQRGADALARADLFVTSHSTAAYEALYHGVPCISLRPEGGALTTPVIEELGLSRRFENGDDLRRFLASFDPGMLRMELNERRRLLSAAGLFFSDGRATARVVAEIRSILQNREDRRPDMTR